MLGHGQFWQFLEPLLLGIVLLKIILHLALTMLSNLSKPRRTEYLLEPANECCYYSWDHNLFRYAWDLDFPVDILCSMNQSKVIPLYFEQLAVAR